MENNTFAIGIPTLNRFDLLYPSLILYLKDFPNTTIFIVDNGKQNIRNIVKSERVIVLEQQKNIGVAASWNLLCEKIFQHHSHALILNDDIYLGKTEEHIIEFLAKNNFRLCVAINSWCAFIMPKKIFELVGVFDTKFYPAYYEDSDYERRLKLKAIPSNKTAFLIPFVYNSSKTMEKAPEIQDFSIKNKQYYVQKWGGIPSMETFRTPFDTPLK